MFWVTCVVLAHSMPPSLCSCGVGSDVPISLLSHFWGQCFCVFQSNLVFCSCVWCSGWNTAEIYAIRSSCFFLGCFWRIYSAFPCSYRGLFLILKHPPKKYTNLQSMNSLPLLRPFPSCPFLFLPDALLFMPISSSCLLSPRLSTSVLLPSLRRYWFETVSNRALTNCAWQTPYFVHC